MRSRCPLDPPETGLPRGRIALAACLLALAVAVAGPAAATSLSVSPSTGALDVHGVTGVLEMELVSGVPAGGALLDGSAPAEAVSLVVGVSLDPGSSPIVPASALAGAHFGVYLEDAATANFISPDAVGWLPGGEPGAAVGVTDAVADPVSNFDWSDSLQGGESVEPFFVSFDASLVENGDAIGIGFGTSSGGTQGYVAQVVPEPSAALLLGGGLAGLALRRRG